MTKPPAPRPLTYRYGLAIVAVVLAWLARKALTPAIGPTALPFITFFPAVAWAAWYGGFGPGLLALVLSALVSAWFFVEPLNSIRLDNPVAAIAFPVAAGIILAAIEAMHRARNDLTTTHNTLVTTLKSIGDGVIVTDTHGNVTFLNSEAQRLTGWKQGDAVGRPLAEVFKIVNERTRDTVDNPVARVLRDGSVVGLGNHTVLIARDGSETPIDDSAAPIIEPGQAVAGVVLVFRDVRGQRLAEATRAQLAAIVETSGDAIVSKSVDGTVLTWNAAAKNLFGYEAEEIVGRSILTLIPPELREEEDMILSRLRSGRPSELIETTRLTKGGRRIPVSVRVSPLRNADGEIIGASTTARDLSALVAARDALTREKDLLATTLASIGDAVIITDADGYCTFLNPVAEHLTGWKAADASGQPLSTVFHIVHEATRKKVENPALRAMTEGTIVGLANHTVLLARNGVEFAIDDSAAPIFDRQRHVVGSVLVFRDVTTRRRTEGERERLRAELSARAHELQTIFEIAPIQFWFGDAEARTFYGNRRAYDEFGLKYGEKTPLEAPITELPPGFRFEVNGQTLAPFEPMRIAAETGKPVQHFEHDVVHPDGRRQTMWANVAPLFDENGKVRGVVGVYIDVTSLRVAERAMREADQRKNEFLATLAHELRNPLAPIRNSITLLQLKGPPVPELVEARSVIDRQLQQISRLLDDLLDVNRLDRRKLELRKEPVALSAVITSAIETSRPAIEHRHHNVSVDVPSDVVVHADPVRLSQVFANLLNNAAKYMDDGGQIWVHAVRDGKSVDVSVKDSGMGIAAESLPRLFELFSQVQMSVERAQGGAGIGLSLAKGLVELHGGTISARSEGLGKGSEFLVRLPVLGGATVPLPSREQERPIRGASAHRILVADDVHDNADTLAMMLRAAGHTVEVAYDGHQAIEAAERFRPDVGIFDIAMPIVNGLDACREIRTQPWGQSIYMIAQTGWGQEEDRKRAHEAGFDRHMLKPVDSVALLTVLANLPRRVVQERTA